MFRDTQKELARLEAELLAEELPEEDLPEEEGEGDSEESTETPHYRAYNSDISDEDLEEYAEEVLSPGRKGLSGFLVFLLILLTGGLVVLVMLFLRQEGIL